MSYKRLETDEELLRRIKREKKLSRSDITLLMSYGRTLDDVADSYGMPRRIVEIVDEERRAR